MNPFKVTSEEYEKNFDEKFIVFELARKHWASVGVVTQDIQDITGNKIVKDAIISNSGVFILLDQSKFKEKFAPIADTLALTAIDKKKIFTINRLENKEGRGQFKEVFIKRGNNGMIIGVEEPHECYMGNFCDRTLLQPKIYLSGVRLV